MAYQITRVTVPPVQLLVVRRRAALRELSQVVPAGCGAVWEFIRSNAIMAPGRNVAVYLNGNIDLEVGVEVPGDVVTGGEIVVSATPSGTMAMVTHWGPYHQLGQAHAAIVEWGGANGESFSGVNWEVYGHWNSDPMQCRTDVYYALSPR